MNLQNVIMLHKDVIFYSTSKIAELFIIMGTIINWVYLEVEYQCFSEWKHPSILDIEFSISTF